MKKSIIYFLAFLIIVSNTIVPTDARTYFSNTINEEYIVYDQYFKLENNKFIEINPTSRQIASADLHLQFQISPKFSGNKVEKIYVRFLYAWLNTPINRFTDKIAVAWNNCNFELDEDTFEKVDQYTFNGKEYDFNHEYRGTSFSEQGVTWDADLAGLHTGATNLDGFGMFYLVPKTTVTKGTSVTFYGSYVHMYLGGSCGFEFKGAGIQITNPTSCNSAGIQKKVTLN